MNLPGNALNTHLLILEQTAEAVLGINGKENSVLDFN
jgi:hypothetical protein